MFMFSTMAEVAAMTMTTIMCCLAKNDNNKHLSAIHKATEAASLTLSLR